MRRSRTTADRGATSVEYALMVSLIAMAVSGAVATLGTGVSASFDRACAALSAGAACDGGSAPDAGDGAGKGKGNQGANGNHGTGNNGNGKGGG